MSDFRERPYFVYEFETSYVEMGKNQFWEGYCILFHKDKTIPHLDDLPLDQRDKYLMEMSILGQAMREVLGARRINYNILGNTDPIIHAHLFPRYDWEDEDLRQTVVWKYDLVFFRDPANQFDPAKHAPLQARLTEKIDQLYQDYLRRRPGWGS